MRYRTPPAGLFIENRRRFLETLPADAACVVLSNDVAQTNADGTRAFIQNSYLFWLTGIDQEETVLLIGPGASPEDRSVLLFIRESTAHTVTWEGNKLSKEDAEGLSGVGDIRWSSGFDAALKRVLNTTQTLYLCLDHHAGRTLGPVNRNHRFAQWCKSEFPLHQYQNASTLINPLRMRKAPQEIACIRSACEITRHAFLAACRSVRPGKYEFEIEAEYAREIIKRGGRFAYEPIIASGESSCILHYISNDRVCQDGDVLLMDVGATYANYASDMTRTVPVSGRFSTRQRAVYTAVHAILAQAARLMTEGASISEYHDAVNTLADEALVDLRLISTRDLRSHRSEKPARAQYFLHKTMHHLGLDVHDCDDGSDVFTSGMVLTCEPGIYIKEEGIGIRLENNILITGHGNQDLMENIPMACDEIEALINA